MKKLILFYAIFLLFYKVLCAQKQEINFEHKLGFVKNIYQETDTMGTICLLLSMNESKGHIALISPEKKVVYSQAQSLKLGQNAYLIGSSHSSNQFVFYFHTGYDRIYTISVTYPSGKVEQGYFKLDKKDNLINAIPGKKGIYLICKNNNQLRFLYYHETKLIGEKTLNMDNEEYAQLNNFVRRGSVLKNEKEQTLLNGSTLSKVYVKNENQLVFLKTKKNKTRLAYLNLSNKSVYYKDIENKEVNKLDIQDLTLLYENKLITQTLFSDGMFISVHSDDGTLLAKKAITLDEIAALEQGNMMHIFKGEFEKVNVKKVFPSTLLLRTPTLLVSSFDENRINLVLGIYQQRTNIVSPAAIAPGPLLSTQVYVPIEDVSRELMDLYYISLSLSYPDMQIIAHEPNYIDRISAYIMKKQASNKKFKIEEFIWYADKKGGNGLIYANKKDKRIYILLD